MIGRMWRGWTAAGGDAEAYERLLREKILPHIREGAGCRGAWLMREQRGDEVEFVTLTLFTSLDAVRAFAGEDYETAVVPPEVRALLARFDQRSRHYEIVEGPLPPA